MPLGNATSTSLYARRQRPASDVPKNMLPTLTLIATRKFFRKISKRLFFIVAIIALTFTTSCSKKTELHTFTGRTMGTTYSVKVVTDSDTKIPKDFQQQIDTTLEEVNAIFSTYLDDSELSRLNRAPEGGWVSISTSLFYLLDMSKQLNKLTEGAFDVTVGPLVNLWGFGPGEMEDKLPSEEMIAAARNRVGDYLFELDAEKSAINRKADIYIDLSAIAKGYGVDVIANLLQAHGFENYMVEIGGELYLEGYNASGQPWTIGVEKPSLGHEGAVQVIALTSAGVATSGDYRNYVEIEGQRFSHTIDPATGRPIIHTLASVTVIAPTAAEADGLATAINVLGPERGFEFAEQRALAVYMLVRDGEKFVSKHTQAFEKYLN